MVVQVSSCVQVSSGLRRVVPLARLQGATPDGVFVLAVDLMVSRPAIWCLDLPGAAAWIGGTSVPDGGRVRLEPDRSRLMVLTPANTSRFSPRFWASEDPAAEARRLAARCKQMQPYFVRLRKLAPTSEEGRRLDRVLTATGDPPQ